MQQLNENGKPIISEQYIRPARAEKIMKNAHNAKQTLFVCGPTGYGKTTLVADMLARRRYHYLQTEDIGHLIQKLDEILSVDRMGKEKIVVIDDMHQIESDEAKESLIPRLQKLMVRADIWLILISRSEVPA